MTHSLQGLNEPLDGNSNNNGGGGGASYEMSMMCKLPRVKIDPFVNFESSIGEATRHSGFGLCGSSDAAGNSACCIDQAVTFSPLLRGSVANSNSSSSNVGGGGSVKHHQQLHQQLQNSCLGQQLTTAQAMQLTAAYSHAAAAADGGGGSGLMGPAIGSSVKISGLGTGGALTTTTSATIMPSLSCGQAPMASSTITMANGAAAARAKYTHNIQVGGRPLVATNPVCVLIVIFRFADFRLQTYRREWQRADNQCRRPAVQCDQHNGVDDNVVDVNIRHQYEQQQRRRRRTDKEEPQRQQGGSQHENAAGQRDIRQSRNGRH